MPIREKAVERALQLDSQLGEAYSSLAQIHRDNNRYEQAEAAYQRSIELSPNYATAYHWYSILLGNFPLRIQEQVEMIKKAVELDPGSSIIGSNLASAYAAQGLYALTKRQYQKVMQLDPEFQQVVGSFADFNVFTLGRFDKGVELSLKALAMDPGNIGNLTSLATAYDELNDRKAFEATLRQMESLDTDHMWTAFMTVIGSMSNDNPAGSREAINWVLPKLKYYPGLTNLMGDLELVLGDVKRSRDIYLTVSPGWLEPDAWEQLISQFTSQACLVSWVLINTGDQPLGTGLLAQITEYLDEALPAVIEHTDAFTPEICYLTGGDTEKALTSLETQLAHNHIFGWDIRFRLPMYDQIRTEPRFLAVIAERERRVVEQREAVAQMAEDTAP